MEDPRLRLANQLEQSKYIGKCFIGFDGFTDEILDLVETRTTATLYQPVKSMAEFGTRILQSVGRSCNVELITKRVKIGGQAPILAQALVEGGHQLTLVGLLGSDEIEPLFEPLASRCERVYSLGASSRTLAIEFSDGKVMLGRHDSVHQVTWQKLLHYVPIEKLIHIHEDLDLFVSGNWTMLLGTSGIWKGLLTEVAPHLSDRPRWMFVDLADPAKRSDVDLKEALELLTGLTSRYRIVLGLNVAEAIRVGSVCGVTLGIENPAQLQIFAKQILSATGLFQIVIHAIEYAVAADENGTAHADGPGSPPILTTGGGDNFNAGYCHALLNGWSMGDALLAGVTLSGFYVSHARSPTIKELTTFLRLWAKDEPTYPLKRSPQSKG